LPPAVSRPRRLPFRLPLRLPIDTYLLLIISMVGLASILPARGEAASFATIAVKLAIGLLFFLYGARLSPEAALAGLRHWRLHLTVFASTFVLFPLLGIAARFLVPWALTPSLYLGVLYLTALPSTVQSSIAFTSIAGGNVAAAVCSASASNLLGILLTPLLAGLLLQTHGGGVSAGAVGDIVLQLLVPFLAGQAARPWIGAWTARHRTLLSRVDRGSILLVVYTAFSEGVVSGVWHRVDAVSLAKMFGVIGLLLGFVLVATTLASRALGFSRQDEIAIVFCGSKKSLASGLPMASVLFPPAQVGLIVLPVMLFHQVQLMVCAWLARRYAASGQAALAEADALAAAGGKRQAG
jgi:solute carrier family 10 (sodium/bile acid cotransporter), member 7